MNDSPTVPCGLCGNPTTRTATERCDPCWEAERHLTYIASNQKLRALMVEALPPRDVDNDEMIRRCQAELIKSQTVIINMQEERIDAFEKRLLALLRPGSDEAKDILSSRSMRHALDGWNERASARVAAEFEDKSKIWKRVEPDDDWDGRSWERRRYEHSSGHITLRIELLYPNQLLVTGDARLHVVGLYPKDCPDWLHHPIPHELLPDVLEMLEAHLQRFKPHDAAPHMLSRIFFERLAAQAVRLKKALTDGDKSAMWHVAGRIEALGAGIVPETD